MGDEVNIDKQLFHTRLGNLISQWKDPKKNEAYGGVGSIVVLMGKTEEGPYSKSLALHVCRRIIKKRRRGSHTILVLAPWVRVSGNTIPDHAREILRCHNC